MPEIIITPGELKEHRVEKYSFRTVDAAGSKTEEGDIEVTSKPQEFKLKDMDFSEPKPQEQTQGTEETDEVQENKLEPFSPPTVNKGGEVVEQEVLKEKEEKIEEMSSQNEDLLKRIDELSSSVVKMEMDLEKKEEEHKEELEETKQSSFEEGQEKGAESATNSFKGEMDNYINQLQSSIKKLDSNSLMYEKGLKSLEAELITVALDIAKEVITKEVDNNSKEVARSLASTLLKEVKDASEVTVRVSPKDSEYLKKEYEEHKKIKVETDDAVSPGGVIILSDIGNINGDIHTRYEQIKKHSLENE